MSDRAIDRSAWANLIRNALEAETRGKKAPFARTIGFDVSTVDNWLAKSVEVRESSVRQVAERLGRDLREMLVEVGYYSRVEVGIEDVPPLNVDEEVQRVRESGLPPRVQSRIVASILEMQRVDAERRAKVIDLMIEQARGA